MANFGVIAENEHGESELEELTGNDTGCEVHDNWWDEDPLEEIDEFAQQVRSLAEIRDMVRRMRVARGYYPISAESVERQGQDEGEQTVSSLPQGQGQSAQKLQLPTVVFRKPQGATAT